RDLKISLAADHELAELPVVAALDAAECAVRPRRVVGDRAPPVADIGADIRAGPAVHVEWLIDGVGRLVGEVGRFGRRGEAADENRGRADNLATHDTLLTHATAVAVGSKAQGPPATAVLPRRMVSKVRPCSLKFIESLPLSPR